MIREATAMTVRQNLGELLNEVQYRGDQVLITKGGKPVAAIVDIALFDKIRRMRTEFEALAGRIAAAYRRVPADELEAEVRAAVRASRRKEAK